MANNRSKRASRTVSKASSSADVTLPKTSLAGKAKAARPGTGTPKGQAITNQLTRYVAEAIDAVRTRTDVNDIIRTLTREEGLFSSAMNSMVALASRSGYRLAGFDASGAMSLAVMSAAYSVIDTIDTTHDYSEGYNDRQSLQALLATLQQDVITTGGCGAELVLDKTLFPSRIVPIGYSTITWESDGKGGRYPSQKQAGTGSSSTTDLDYPTVFIGELNRNSDEAYAVSLLRPALSQVFEFNSFLEDTHRAVNRTGHSRLITTITQDSVKKMAPPDVLADPDKLRAFYVQVKSQVEEALSGLEPEDALVSYDSVTHKVEDVGGSKSDYSALLTTLGNLLGVSLKTPATVSGLRAGGSQALSNAETLIYLKTVDAVRPPVEEIMSRALTLAVRLLGIEGYVRFEFNPIDLRPDTELEAYRMSKQKRIMERLSYGLITDAVACHELGIRPSDYLVLLSGSGFYTTDGNEATDNGERETSAGRALASDTPAASGGDDK